MSRRAAARRALTALVVGAVALGVVPAGADDLETAKQRRTEVRQERAALAAELQVLGADGAALVAALDALQADAVAERAAHADATRVADETRVASERAAEEVARMDAQLDELRSLLLDLAVGAYIGGPGAVGGLSMFIGADDVGDAAKAVYLAGQEVARQDAVAADLTRFKELLDVARVAAAASAATAAAARDEVAVRVAAVERARDQQATFVAAVEAELERRLSEAAGLEQLDQQLAADIVRGEEELAARLRAEAEAAARVAAERALADAAERALAEAAHRALHPDLDDTDRPDRPVGLARPPSGRVVGVRGINVDATIAESLEALLAAAAAEGVPLGGGGYRDGAAQIARRAANCGATDFDLYEKPASQCRPPTARPGHSMHERGLAIDFTHAGALIADRSNPGYVWLSANAARFGLYNLPSEPWHWSTDGG